MSHERLEQKERRSFLRKAVYHAPTLFVLGKLAKPAALHADGTGGPDGPPGGFPFSSNTIGSGRKDAPKKRKTLRF